MSILRTDLSKEILNQVSLELNLPAYDLLLIGDGSGTVKDKPCGFACISYDKLRDNIKIHTGALSHGTNNMAELFPYIHALQCDILEVGPMDKGNRYVEIVSDSELIVKQGRKIYGRYSNRALWKAIDGFEELGYTIHWNHVSRNSNVLNELCDKLAGEMRKKLLTDPQG
jgi:ribonuclease HI